MGEGVEGCDLPKFTSLRYSAMELIAQGEYEKSEANIRTDYGGLEMTCEYLTPSRTSTNGPVIYCRINGSKCPYVPYRTFHQCSNFNPITR